MRLEVTNGIAAGIELTGMQNGKDSCDEGVCEDWRIISKMLRRSRVGALRECLDLPCVCVLGPSPPDAPFEDKVNFFLTSSLIYIKIMRSASILRWLLHALGQ